MYRNVSRNLNTGLLLLLLFLCRCREAQSRLPYYNTPDFTPVFISDPDRVADSIRHRIGHFSFMDQNGCTVSDADVQGKIHIADFIFTTCGSICPVMTENLSRAGRYFEGDTSVLILSYTVTPWIDSVPRLKAYQEAKRITNPNWHFLTGRREEIYTLARQSYFAEEELGFTKDNKEFLHTEHILLVDQNGRIRGIYNGTLKLDIDQLIKDVLVLKGEG
ncbi:MAG TPA: SCO family protein [Chitinophagaceae bacterium]|nr:SCO family protein [Chitinophagaceae bacterium]